MRILAQAMRAVLIELLGVVFVLWLLFGAARLVVDRYFEHGSKTLLAATSAFPVPGDSLAGFKLARVDSEPLHVQDAVNAARSLDLYSRTDRKVADDYLGGLFADLHNGL